MRDKNLITSDRGYAALLAHAEWVLYGMELGSVTLKINNQHTKGNYHTPSPEVHSKTNLILWGFLVPQYNSAPLVGQFGEGA